MKRALSFTAGIIGLAIGLIASNVFAQTTANGPYYATPSWDQTLPSATRFIVLANMNSEAVLDRETGLVWERSPSTQSLTWNQAKHHCAGLATGGRRAWRLPVLEELASLADPSVPTFSGFPALPSGHPFTTVLEKEYWAATASTEQPDWAWQVDFRQGGSSGASSAFGTHPGTWCVRGGQGVNPL